MTSATGAMKVSVSATSILRAASGEPPLGIGGLAFRDDQGEMHFYNREASPMAKLGVLELSDGAWLAHPPGFRIDAPAFASRDHALRAAVARMIRQARAYARAKDGEGIQWPEGFAGRVIEWALGLKPEKILNQGAAAVASQTSGHPGTEPGRYKVSVQFSGGAASYVAAKLTLEEFGHDGVALIFADTLIEDEDLYRFLSDAEAYLQHPIIRISEGRDPWTVFFDERMMGNSRIDPCSKILKRKLLDRWRRENCADDCTVVIGYDASEDFRLQPLRARMSPLNVRAPLLEQGIWKEQAYAKVEADGLRLPRLYAMGFPHNNCGGFCVKAGQASFALLLENMPERYAQHEAREEEFRRFIGKDVSIMRDRRGGVSKPLTMRAFRARHQADPALVDRSELGGCNCMDEPTEVDIPTSEEIIPPANPNNGLGVKTPREEITDPVIKALVAANRARTTYPAGHTVAMTNPIVNGQMVTLGTCECGETFSYAWGSYELMDAAIEAHRQKFDHLPEKVDGRGQPIARDEYLAGITAKTKSRKRKSSDGSVESRHAAAATDLLSGAVEAAIMAGADSPAAGVAPGPSEVIESGASGHHPAPLASAPQDVPLAGADASMREAAAWGALSAEMRAETEGFVNEAAPIGAGLVDDVITSLDDMDDLTISWPSYDSFLDDKIVTAPLRGIEVARDTLHPYLKPHCKDLTVWALRLGCAAIFASFGLHKTAMQLEWCRQLCRYTGQPTLCVVPLGVRHGFIKEALQFDMDIRFIRTTEELDELYCEGVRHFLTNYESIREGKLDPNQFEAVTLDEASVLRSYGSKTFQEFLPLFAKVPYKLVATATPSPNRYKELIHYAGFLGVMDTGLALTRWFQRNSEKAGDLTLYPHKAEEFWMWVHSWAAFLQKPSELGHSDDGYELPPLKLTWHEVPADHSKAEPERDGQGVMFRAVASSLSEAAKSRRDSLGPRVAKMLQIIAQDPDSHRIIWHDLEAEREAIEHAVPDVVTITGSMDIDAREARLHDFEEGRTKYFGTKPVLSGSGSNFQYFCHKAIYLALPGYGYKFNDFIQSLYRLQRFGQQHPVEVDIIYSEDERQGRAALEEKWARDGEMRVRMSEIIKQHGLDTLPLRDRLARSIGVKRVEIRGEKFIAINNDAVAEARTWPENSVDQIITSIPFSNHYEYSASYNDFGHTDDNGHFWSQMDFLTAELLRMLKPGRLACIHVKDRVLFGSVTGEGVPTISPFHAEAIMHYRAHGFQYMGMITVVTDVVRENNQTYRLGWSENCKDGTKMGVGSPEYVLLLRKQQSDRTRGYADVPVEKDKEDYTRARWQIDAHSFWRSSGNRHLTPEEFAMCNASDLAKLFARTTVDRVYDYEAHVKIGEAQERAGTLPATFMAIAPGSHHPDVWHDVNRMRTLNMLQQRKGAEMHLCPLQFDIVDRLIERYSNEGDLIYDPFGGLMTVPYRALLKGRRGAATELNATYFLDGVHYLRAAEEKVTTPQLFDLATFDAVNTPPSDEMTEAET